MTVQSQTSRADYTGNGLTTTFPVPFYWLQDSDLLVIRTDNSFTPPTVATLALGTDYVVTGSGNPAGGSITTTVAPTSTQKLSILRNVPFTQLTHYVPNDPFPAASHEQALDKLTMETQQLNEGLSRAITLPPNTTGVSTALPTPLANNFIGWNPTATALQNVDPTTVATSVTYGNARADLFNGDGTTTVFNLSANPGGINNLDISIAGVTQRPGNDYTWTTGTTLTFTAAPPLGTNNILVRYTQALPIGSLGVGQVTDINVAAPMTPAQGVQATKLYFLQAGTGAVARSVQDKARDEVSAPDFGATADGVTDAKATLLTADTACAASGAALRLTKGVYRIASNLTFASAVIFEPGAVLKPDANVTVTFSQNFAAPTSYQIFDLSNTGAFISLPYNLTEVWAEWWGAKGNAVKTNNEVAINQAIAALAATATGGSGVSYGVVRLGRGLFYTSGPINLSTQISLKGSHTFYTLIKANVATWSGGNMVTATTASAPMFSSRLEDMRLDANAIGSINAVVYSNAWQEKCGMFRCYVANFNGNGFSYDTGNGGAAHLRIQQCEFFPNNVNGANAVRVTVPYAQGWLLLRLDEVTCGTPSVSPTGVSAFSLDGRVIAICSGVFSENINNGFLLTNAASVSGSGINGGLNNATVFNMGSSWTGSVDVTGCHIGNATVMVTDSNRVYAMAQLDPADGHLVWPPQPTRAIAAASITSAGAFLYQQGLTSVSRTGVGQYSITMPSMDSSTSYDVLATTQGSGYQIVVSPNSSTNFGIVTRDQTGALIDAPFAVKVFHKS